MPTGVSSGPITKAVKEALSEEGGLLHTTKPLYKMQWKVRLRVGEEFVGRRVEVDVWPNREPDDPENRTYMSCQVLSSGYNPDWGPKGTGVLVLEFEEGLNRKDLPIPTSAVHAIRAIE